MAGEKRLREGVKKTRESKAFEDDTNFDRESLAKLVVPNSPSMFDDADDQNDQNIYGTSTNSKEEVLTSSSALKSEKKKTTRKEKPKEAAAEMKEGPILNGGSDKKKKTREEKTKEVEIKEAELEVERSALLIESFDAIMKKHKKLASDTTN